MLIRNWKVWNYNCFRLNGCKLFIILLKTCCSNTKTFNHLFYCIWLRFESLFSIKLWLLFYCVVHYVLKCLIRNHFLLRVIPNTSVNYERLLFYRNYDEMQYPSPAAGSTDGFVLRGPVLRWQLVRDDGLLHTAAALHRKQRLQNLPHLLRGKGSLFCNSCCSQPSEAAPSGWWNGPFVLTKNVYSCIYQSSHEPQKLTASLLLLFYQKQVPEFQKLKTQVS